MAMKLLCPACCKVLREKGDEMKQNRGTYTAVSGQITCGLCGHQGTVSDFDDLEMEKRRSVVVPGSDLFHAMDCNPDRDPAHREPVQKKDIAQILVEITGANDRANWHWLLRLFNGLYVYIVGGCDNTGWDCQSYLEYWIAPTLEEALARVDSENRAVMRDMIRKGETQRRSSTDW